MNNDILPPKPPNQPQHPPISNLPPPVPPQATYRPPTPAPNQPPTTPPSRETAQSTLPPNQPPADDELSIHKTHRPNKLRRILVTLLALGLLLVIAAVVWYFSAQRPVAPSDLNRREVVINSGSTPRAIAAQLRSDDLIRSELAFLLYTRLQGVQGELQAGSYRLAPSDSLSDIVAQLRGGQAASYSIMFYPGATLYDPTDIADNRRTDVYTMLVRAGYADAEVRAALDKQYDHPIFAGKPRDASIEGYVFGETYQFDSNTSVEQVLEHTFDVFYERIQAADILPKLDEVDMTLYEAITLASVIEREVSGQLEDQRGVSQIFHSRLEIGEPLGADATFMYAAQQRNVTPTISIDSPYNTRLYRGLPPGPIAVPDLDALQAAVNPADTNYLFFVSGDDGRTHFARTNAEHEENTRRYCTTLCTDIAQ